MGKQWKQCQTLFLGAPESLQMVTAAMKLKDAYSLEGKLWQSQQKAETSLYWQRSIKSKLWFSSSHVQMWELSHKEGWAPKNSCFWTAVLEKSLESHLDCKEIKPVHPKGNQCWMTDAGVLILWPPHVKSRLIGKDPDAEKDWRQMEKWVAEDEMVR